MLDCNTLAKFIRAGNNGDCDGTSIIPEPETGTIETSGEASVTLRLGRWFITLRQTSHPFFDVMASANEAHSEARSAKRWFIPFGQEFILHPGRFVLASTLEWLSFPSRLGGYVVGKSTWARRGLIVETAAGIHPGFNGCLTLELANVGEVPIRDSPRHENRSDFCPRTACRQTSFEKPIERPQASLSWIDSIGLGHGEAFKP